jgi:hypothetical protein
MTDIQAAFAAAYDPAEPAAAPLAAGQPAGDVAAGTQPAVAAYTAAGFGAWDLDGGSDADAAEDVADLSGGQGLPVLRANVAL